MDTSSAKSSPTITATSPTQAKNVYLKRLERLQRLRTRHEQELNHQGVRLVNRSIFEAYCICREIGAEHEARAILGQRPAQPAA